MADLRRGAARAADFLAGLYAIFVGLAVAGGLAVLVCHLVGLARGGGRGAGLMALARDVLGSQIIRLTALGVLSGLIVVYLQGAHALSLRRKGDAESGDEGDGRS